jgi:3-hydroxymyristoyl/3-hydroxydecanoyl-(acyl carrier protein) dehydratase
MDLDKSTYENKLVFLMGVEKARFRNPVIPDCKLNFKIEAIRSHGKSLEISKVKLLLKIRKWLMQFGLQQ